MCMRACEPALMYAGFDVSGVASWAVRSPAAPPGAARAGLELAYRRRQYCTFVLVTMHVLSLTRVLARAEHASARADDR
jgi:hypothetical protein